MVKKIFGAVAVVALAFAFTVNFAAAATYNFTQNLTIGSQGAEVVMLQDFLVSKGHLVIPAGVSKGYFGALTQAALGKYQASVGISPAAGYFGPITRQHLNTLEMGGGSSTGGDDNSSGDLQGGDGDFRQFKILGNPSNEDVGEGETVEVLGFEFEADDSDLRIERVDALFADLDSKTKPWRVFDEVLLLDADGDEIASVDASDSSEWEEEEDDEYSIRFEDVDYVVEEGDKVQLFIAVTASDSIKTADLDQWGVQLMRDGVRALNAIGIDVYEGGADDDIDGGTGAGEKRFQLEVAQAGEFDITVDKNDNKDRTVSVDEDDETDEVVLYIANIEGDEGDNLIEEITIDLATTSGTVGRLDEIIKTLYLFIDGDEVGSESVDGGGTASVTFDDIDFDLDEGDEVEVRVEATINEQDGSFDNGDGVQVMGISVDYVDENDDDLTETDNTEGGEITFSVGAIQVDFVSEDSAAPLAGDESKGRFKVRFTISAPENDAIYIPKGATATTSAVDSGRGAVFQIVDGNGTVFASTTATQLSSNLLNRISGGSNSGDYYKINKKQSATFELDIVVSNTGHANEQTLGIELTGINYKVGGSAGPATEQHTAGLDDDFRSSTEYLLTENTQN